MATEALVDIGSLITATPGVYGGLPRLARTGFPIIQLVAELRAGDSIEDVIQRFGLDEASGYAGLAFYLANKHALDTQLDERNAMGLKMQEEARDAQLAWQRSLPRPD